MGKHRSHSQLDQALFVLLIVVGSVMAAVLEVQVVSGALTSGKHGPSTAIAVASALPTAPVAAASAASGEHATVIGRLTRYFKRGRATVRT
jgi:hypothetical protein